jgi:GDP-L-fucose synthase
MVGIPKSGAGAATSSLYSLRGKRAWVAGHRGMVGSALVRRLRREECHVLTVSPQEVDLTRQENVERWMQKKRPQAIIIAAAKVGGILANDTYPAEFLYDNLMIEANIIRSAKDVEAEKLLFLGSSCVYPRLAPQPIAEEELLTGPLEKTNEWYAIAKIAGIKLCQAFRREFGCDFITAMPTNLYGPGDNFDLERSHVMAALIRKAHEAKIRGDRHLVVWGTGKPRREFLHVDDAADALVYLMKNYSGFDPVNVGSGEDLSIMELAKRVAEVVGFRGDIVLDPSKPDGTPRKWILSDKLFNLGWRPSIRLSEGVPHTYRWYTDQLAAVSHDRPR